MKLFEIRTTLSNTVVPLAWIPRVIYWPCPLIRVWHWVLMWTDVAWEQTEALEVLIDQECQHMAQEQEESVTLALDSELLTDDES